MSWPNPFLQRDDGTRNAWGHVFQWTSDHQTPEQYNHLKYSYDTLGEECVNILNEHYPPEKPSTSSQKQASVSEISTPREEKSSAPSARPTQDLYKILRDNHHKHEKLQQLWDELTTTPDWVDWDQIARGQDVFYRYGIATITGLTYQSLLGGTSGSRVAEVLSRTGGFSIKIARRRLLETTQHVLECTKSLESIKTGGAGFASSLRVRLLHAKVRQRILQLVSMRPSYYSVEEYGVPINDLDCIGTIAVFSATLIWQSLPRQGIFLRQQEILDYLALWRLVALYMGTPTEYFSTPIRAKAIMESLQLYEYSPSVTSGSLARNIIRAMENTPPVYASRSFLEVNARWLNGNQLADALGIGRPPLYYWCLTAGHCLFYMAIFYSSRIIPSLDRHQIATSRRTLWSVVVESKDWGLGSLTVFDFKYIPGFGVGMEGEEDVEERKSKNFWTADRMSLFMLLVVGFVTFFGAWAWCRVAFWVWWKIFRGS
ncbi:hypothetical protein DM02DRAFT_685133 [Periconia macrospinosa]|uniref:ER-bound oxygenase mpaB/mpaB'/Rubber oxygenase catalytic domain-containing protein n=1 Tax=Periconia macrospinosa TaxID=97972 RepID=A0A2V1DH13_9PLEO|nr:hypothetical protein DM02DRAFT_685133 [Periconia macrospinosa]